MREKTFRRIRTNITVLALILGLLTSGIFFSEPVYAIASGVTASGGNAQYYIGGTAATVDDSIILTGFVSDISEASVSVRNLKAGDQLQFTNNYGITGSYNAGTGILTLSGTTTSTNYQSALRTVTFSTTSADTTDRIIDFSIGSGLYNSDNGHFYEYVSAENISWNNAVTSASAMTLYGRVGYLVTITDAAENSFVTQKVEGLGWIGAKDIHYVNTSSDDNLGDWRWVTGPEGTAVGGGTQFFTGYFGASASAIGYENWWSGEPNNGNNLEYVAHIFGPVSSMPNWAKTASPAAQPGEWNDFEPGRNDGAVKGFIVEYGGMAGDTPLNLQSSKTIDILTPTPIAVMVGSGSFSSGNVGGDSDKTLIWKRGTANTAGGDVVLTNSDHQAGSIVRRNQIKLVNGFSTYFQMYFSGDADGIAFIAYKADAPKLGDFAGALGYGDFSHIDGDNAIHNSIAVEFDTWDNYEAENPYDSLIADATMNNHVAIMLDGNATHNAQSVQAIVTNAAIGGQTINAWVDYDAANNTITATYGTGVTKGAITNNTIIRSLSGADQIPRANDNIFVGFTSSTGGNLTTHKILKWYFKDSYVVGGLDPSAGAYTQAASTIELTLSSATNPDTVTIVTFDAAGNEMENQVIELFVDGISAGSFNTGTNGYVYNSSGLAVGSHTVRAVALGGASNYSTFTVQADSSSGSSSHSNTSQTTGVDVIVNGQVQSAGKQTESIQNGIKTSEVDVDETIVSAKIDAVLAAQQENQNQENVIEVPVSSDADNIKVVLTGDIVKKMDDNDFTLNVSYEDVSYLIPAEEFKIPELATQLGAGKLTDIEIKVEFQTPDTATIAKIAEQAQAKEYEIVIPPLNFEVIAVNTNTKQQTSISKYMNYVERMFEIPSSVDPNKITTGIVYNSDGTFSHIPTEIVKIGDKYFAKLNSLTNSTYSVIWNPVIFADMENHWAKDAADNMGSRLVVNGVGNGNFDPDRAITRGEFAAIITKALGIFRTGVGTDQFSDVQKDNIFYDAISIADDYGLIIGYTNGLYEPNKSITREEAMAILTRAADIVKLETNSGKTSSSFTDAEQISDWAKTYVDSNIQKGIIIGSDGLIRPKSVISRAEVVTAVERMLKATELINSLKESK